MLEDSDDVIILKHTWSLANRVIQNEFFGLLQGVVSSEPPFDVPYAAALRMWCRLSESQQQQLLTWFKDHMADSGPSPVAANDSVVPYDAIAPLMDPSGFVSVSTIWKSRFHSYQAFTKWLNRISITEVRRRKPNRRRLEINLGDWVQFWERHDREQASSMTQARVAAGLAG